jgi:uncharacterized protein YyaL (SSP411 family)
VAELLGSKFILVRADTDEAPELAERFGPELPQVIVLNAAGDTVWETEYLQPTPFNQGLFKVLRDENPVVLPRNATATYANRAALNANLPYQLDLGLVTEFDAIYHGYETPKALSVDYLRFDLLVGTALQSTDARGRLVFQLDSLWAALRDSVDGGFLAGTTNADWKALRPEKFAVDQARMAAVLAEITRQRDWARAYSLPVTAYLEGAAQAVRYLEEKLVDGDRVAKGELGTLAYYRSGLAERKLERSPQVSPVFDTATAGRTAAALAQAGMLTGNEAWVTRAAGIATASLAGRTPQGLFYHLPGERKGANRLPEAAAMLEASLALYAATADDAWLAAAQSIAKNLAPLRAPAGYFVAATDTVFPPETPLGQNARIAEGLWRLGAVTNDVALRTAAFETMEEFGAVAPGPDLPAFALAIFTMTGPIARLELPRAWRTRAEAAPLARPASPFAVVKWIDGDAGRVCTPTACGAAQTNPQALLPELAAATVPPIKKE